MSLAQHDHAVSLEILDPKVGLDAARDRLRPKLTRVTKTTAAGAKIDLVIFGKASRIT